MRSSVLAEHRRRLALGVGLIGCFGPFMGAEVQAQSPEPRQPHRVSVELPPVRMTIEQLRGFWREAQSATVGRAAGESPADTIYGFCHLFTTVGSGAEGKSLDSALPLIPRGEVLDRVICSVHDRLATPRNAEGPERPIVAVGLNLHRSSSSIVLEGYDTTRIHEVAGSALRKLKPYAPRLSLKSRQSLHSGGMAIGLLLAPAALLYRRRRVFWLLALASAARILWTYSHPPPKSMRWTEITTR